MNQPVWQAEGWRANGPGGCVCPGCGRRVSTNALARRAHAKGCEKLHRMGELRAVPRERSV